MVTLCIIVWSDFIFYKCLRMNIALFIAYIIGTVTIVFPTVLFCVFTFWLIVPAIFGWWLTVQWIKLGKYLYNKL